MRIETAAAKDGQHEDSSSAHHTPNGGTLQVYRRWLVFRGARLSVQFRHTRAYRASCPCSPVAAAFQRAHCGEKVPKRNYHQAKKQKELARKSRQQEKQQRRLARPTPPDAETSGTPAQTDLATGVAAEDSQP